MSGRESGAFTARLVGVGTFWGPDFAELERTDPEIASVLLGELARLRGGLQLIASENLTSPAVLAALGSTPTNQYAHGDPGRRGAPRRPQGGPAGPPGDRL